MTEKRIRSIKLDKGKVELDGVETWGSGNERTWKLTSYEDPAPELPAKINALEKHVRDLLELPKNWAKDSFRVIKVSWSFSESTGIQGATVTCLVDLEATGSPLVINTPHLPYKRYSPTGNQPTMPNQMREALDEVERQAEDYLAGKRSQGELFGKRADKTEKPAATAPLTEQATEVVDSVVAKVFEAMPAALEREGYEQTDDGKWSKTDRKGTTVEISVPTP